jgi:hypothetical protein
MNTETDNAPARQAAARQAVEKAKREWSAILGQAAQAVESVFNDPTDPTDREQALRKQALRERWIREQKVLEQEALERAALSDEERAAEKRAWQAKLPEPLDEGRFDYWAACTACGGRDGWRNIFSSHWCYCDIHRQKWRVGMNVISEWKDEDDTKWEENAAYLADYQDTTHESPTPTAKRANQWPSRV